MNSNSGRFLAWKYLWRIVLGGLAFLSLEGYFFIRVDFIRYLVNPASFFQFLLGLVFINLIVAWFIIFISPWREPKSLKAAILALDSCSLPFLPLAIIIYSLIDPTSISDNVISIMLIFIPSLTVLSLILSIIGLAWGLDADRKGNLLNPRAGEAVKLSRIALVASVVIMIPQFCFVFYGWALGAWAL
jgi:hypothetical protein